MKDTTSHCPKLSCERYFATIAGPFLVSFLCQVNNRFRVTAQLAERLHPTPSLWFEPSHQQNFMQALCLQLTAEKTKIKSECSIKKKARSVVVVLDPWLAQKTRNRQVPGLILTHFFG